MNKEKSLKTEGRRRLHEHQSSAYNLITRLERCCKPQIGSLVDLRKCCPNAAACMPRIGNYIGYELTVGETAAAIPFRSCPLQVLKRLTVQASGP